LTAGLEALAGTDLKWWGLTTGPDFSILKRKVGLFSRRPINVDNFTPITYSDIPLNLYHSLWSAIRIIANGSGAIILIALQRVGTVLQEYYYIIMIRIFFRK
jgi:hypothetical protein